MFERVGKCYQSDIDSATRTLVTANAMLTVLVSTMKTINLAFLKSNKETSNFPQDSF